MKFITPQGEKNIRQFQYRGQNVSLSYNYLWSPLAEKLLDFTPKTIAPNTLTVVGLLLHTVATILICLQTPWNTDLPRWMLFLYGFCVFWYQTLDNIDGKQARRLQNSTALGMIMDHGCDALGVICLTAGMSRVVCMDDPTLFLWVFISVQFSFYVSAWCQYWSNGIMILGKVNGVDDGIPIIWAFGFISSFIGQQYWRMPVTLFGHTLLVNQMMAYSIIASTFIQIYSVASQSGDHFTKEVGKALRDLIHTVMLVATLFAISFYSNFGQKYVVGISIGLAFTMARTVSNTLVCSTAKMTFNQFSPSVLVFTFGYIGYVFLGRTLCSPALIVYGIAAFAVIEYSVFVVSISNQIANTLNIPIFSVYKPQKARQ